MKKLLHKRPSPAMIVALLALFIAIGGTSYATFKVGAKNIKRGAVRSKAVADDSLRSGDIKNNDLTGGDVKDHSLRSADIDGSNLFVAAAGTAGNATNADKLGGIDSTSFTRSGCSVQNGAVHGYARIVGSGAFSSTFTTAGVESAYNCSGQSVEARRNGPGFYEIRFNGVNPTVAVASSLQAPSVSPSNVDVSLSLTGTGTIAAAVENNGGGLTDFAFAVVMF